VLLIAADPGARDFILRRLGRLRISTAASSAEASYLLTAHRYGLVLVTNFGISAHDAVSVIPAGHDYAVLYLTGHINDRIAAACAERAIPWLRVPEDIENLRREVRLALDAPGI
jgi:hypothetical protein